MDDTKQEVKDTSEKKVNKKVARSRKNASKKTVGKGDGGETASKHANAPKSSLVNNGKCCRCSFRSKEHKCTCKGSEQHNKYVARKFGCNSFKYS